MNVIKAIVHACLCGFAFIGAYVIFMQAFPDVINPLYTIRLEAVTYQDSVEVKALTKR